MQEYYIDSSKNTPSLYFNPQKGVLDIRGTSTSANPLDFYKQVHDYLDIFTQSNYIELTVNIALEHMNTSTSKCLYLLFDRIDKSDKFIKIIGINWYCNSDDESCLIFGNQLKEILDIELNVIKTESERPLNVGKLLATEYSVV